jgi:hypothetical protein
MHGCVCLVISLTTLRPTGGDNFVFELPWILNL